MADYYSLNAERLYKEYRRLDFKSVHDAWLEHLPDKPGLACDLGAGSGRDANWLAGRGWDVIAVEPCGELRDLAVAGSHPGVTWLDGRLPGLSRLRRLDHRFDLILLSAVWMHIPPRQRERAFRIISDCLAPGGILVISLRQDADREEKARRGLFEVDPEEIASLARKRAIAVLGVETRADLLERPSVRWETVILQLPDDGSGSLPLLRHIIVNDDKAATYKLGLLRALVKIAEGAPGMVIRRTDEYVDIPFGLVGLYWIKLYLPLVLRHGLKQSPAHRPREMRGLGFAKPDHFYRLDTLSPYDLRIGASFGPDLAQTVIGAINDACANIRQMPARFITYPGSDRPVFLSERSSVRFRPGRGGSAWQLNRETLSQFGTFRVPAHLWQSMGRYACWIEPAVVNEWARLMQGYEVAYDRARFDQALVWEEGRRDTSLARARASELQHVGTRLHCVWTDALLRGSHYEIDHCFPWSRWLNNDLWNLVPASVSANSSKREKLPSSGAMHRARERILQWWELAYLGQDLAERFMIEAEAALPLVESGRATPGQVYDAMLHQRARLRANLQLAEWRIP